MRAVAGTVERVVGVDASLKMVEIARRRSASLSNVEFFVGSAEALPFPAATFTSVWTIQSWHHWNDSLAGLTEAARVLRPGGIFAVIERKTKGDHGLSENPGSRAGRRSWSPVGFVRTAVTRQRKFLPCSGSVGPSSTEANPTSEADDVIWWVRRQSCVEVRKAPDLDAVDRIEGAALGCLCPTFARGWVAPPGLALGQVAFERTHIAHHEQHARLLGDHRKTFADRIALSQHEGVVVEEEHSDDLDTVHSGLQLGKDHLRQFVAGGPWVGEHVGDLHVSPFPCERAKLARWPKVDSGG